MKDKHNVNLDWLLDDIERRRHRHTVKYETVVQSNSMHDNLMRALDMQYLTTDDLTEAFALGVVTQQEYALLYDMINIRV